MTTFKLLKNFAKTVAILGLVIQDTTAVNPRPMAFSFYSSVSNMFGSVLGTNDQNNNENENAVWPDIQTTLNQAHSRITELFGADNDADVPGVLETGRLKFEEFIGSLPEMARPNLDFNRFKQNIGNWNWETFLNEIMPTSTPTAESEDFEESAEILPEAEMTTPEIIRFAGYKCEVHRVVTDDGYVLQLFRIISNKTTLEGTKPVVFFQHGFLADSSTWVTNEPKQSLAFLLADAGCDVWLGNVRGSTYARSHISLNPDSDEKYWRFSWQEMAEYDLPAIVKKALQVSKAKKLNYIGHSQGTLIAFAKLSEDQEFSKHIRMLFALGPVSTLGNITSPVKSLVFLSKPIRFGMSLFGGAEILPKKPISRWISAKLHKFMKREESKNTIPHQVAYHGTNYMMFMCGLHPEHYFDDRMPVYFSHTPAGTSLQNLMHMAQLVECGKMQKWDHWSESGNMEAYGQVSPPYYDVSRISTPVALFVGSEDQLADPEDSKLLALKLTNLVYYKTIDGWDHLDFLWGKNSIETIYDDILNFILTLNRVEKDADRGEL